MRTLLVCLIIQIVMFAVGFGQEKIDVVYLNNGDIRKGVIIENAPNDHIKIETFDGSIFTIKYADIQKMTTESKQIPMNQQYLQTQERPKGLMARNGDFGVTAGVWLAGDFSLEDFGVKRQKNAGFLLRTFYDAYVAEKIAVGAYFNFSPTSSPASSHGATMIEFGGSIKPRFPLGDGSAVIKPGLNIGYRMYSSDSGTMDKVNALGLNASVEIQFDVKNIFVPYVEIGFLAQPVGGNDITGISFPPIIYIAGGIAF
jgi:hypothetical protein